MKQSTEIDNTLKSALNVLNSAGDKVSVFALYRLGCSYLEGRPDLAIDRNKAREHLEKAGNIAYEKAMKEGDEKALHQTEAAYGKILFELCQEHEKKTYLEKLGELIDKFYVNKERTFLDDLSLWVFIKTAPYCNVRPWKITLRLDDARIRLETVDALIQLLIDEKNKKDEKDIPNGRCWLQELDLGDFTNEHAKLVAALMQHNIPSFALDLDSMGNDGSYIIGALKDHSTLMSLSFCCSGGLDPNGTELLSLTKWLRENTTLTSFTMLNYTESTGRRALLRPILDALAVSSSPLQRVFLSRMEYHPTDLTTLVSRPGLNHCDIPLHGSEEEVHLAFSALRSLRVRCNFGASALMKSLRSSETLTELEVLEEFNERNNGFMLGKESNECVLLEARFLRAIQKLSLGNVNIKNLFDILRDRSTLKGHATLRSLSFHACHICHASSSTSTNTSSSNAYTCECIRIILGALKEDQKYLESLSIEFMDAQPMGTEWIKGTLNAIRETLLTSAHSVRRISDVDLVQTPKLNADFPHNVRLSQFVLRQKVTSDLIQKAEAEPIRKKLLENELKNIEERLNWGRASLLTAFARANAHSALRTSVLALVQAPKSNADFPLINYLQKESVGLIFSNMDKFMSTRFFQSHVSMQTNGVDNAAAASAAIEPITTMTVGGAAAAASTVTTTASKATVSNRKKRRR